MAEDGIPTHSALENVCGRAYRCCDEASHQAGVEVRDHVILEVARAEQELLEEVVRRQLACVHEHGPGDIWTQAAKERGEAFFAVDLLDAVKSASMKTRRNWLSR